MALNPYFTQGTRGEQSLVQDLINEQLRTYGVDVHYIPRKYLTSNTVIKEVIQSKFDDAYPIEAYVKSDSYEGAGILMSKFGVQQQDDVTLIISRERWETYIQPLIQNEQDIKLSSRPKGGDLIYFPLDDRLYEIKFVEYADPFYQLQDLYTYELRCEVFRYEDEVIDTGIGDIDDSMEDAGYAETLKLIGIGQTATVSTSVVDGALKFISLTNQGQGYTSIPTVAISSAPGGIQATAVAIMTSRTGFATASSIDRVLMINPGAGYTVPPTVVFVGGGGSGAIATVGLATTGAVGIITVSNGGSGYSTPPTVTIDTPTHVGASATAVIDHPIGAGVSVLSAPIGIGAANFLFPVETTGGRFYSRTPQVTFALPTGGSNTASATATMGDFDSTGGTVASIAVNGEGKFYDQANPPTVTISAPGFSRATATIGLSGTSINPNSVAFTTTGRGYSSTPTVSIGLGTGLSTGQTAIGIATINIAGVVTAVSFNESDSWAVGTGATIGFGYTLTPTITFGSPSPVNATATPTVSVAGTITAISIGNSGFGYAPGTTATISISSPGGANEAFRALGVATMRFDSVKTEGTIGIGSTFITGITTTGILLGDRVRLQYDYDNTLTNYILDGTHVTQIDPNIVYMSAAATNTGIGTTSIEFGINGCGIVTGIAVTFGGGGYIEPPVISIANSAADKNYSSLEVGVNTATAEAILNSSGEISAIRISDSGDKYTLGTNNLPPQISFSSPSLVGSGDYTYNEIVTGGTTGTKARVKKWISSTKELRVSIANGTFTSGETITGQDSGAVYTLSTVDTDDLIDAYADNDNIQTEADGILDFTQRNPFGEV